MSLPFSSNHPQQVPWLPGERFELALDSHKGVFTRPSPGVDLLTVTNHRAVQLRRQAGRNSTTLIPLNRIVAIDIVDASRPTERLIQGLAVLAVGVLLAWIAWTVVGVDLIALLLGGVPSLIGIYIITGYVFPDSTGELILRTGGHALHHPLESSEARRGAYLFAHRVYELMTSGGNDASAGPNAGPSMSQSQPWPQGGRDGDGEASPSASPFPAATPAQPPGPGPASPTPPSVSGGEVQPLLKDSPDAPERGPETPSVPPWQRWRSNDET